MMTKKAQVALFIVITLLIVAAIAFVFVFKAKEEAKPTPEENIAALQGYTAGCIEDAAENAIVLAGLQGGRIEKPALFLAVDYGWTSYGYYEGNSTLLSKEQIEAELAGFIKGAILNYCNLTQFRELNITTDEISPLVLIEESYVRTITSWPMLVITKDGTRYMLDKEYIATFPIRLGKLHSIAAHIVADLVEDPEKTDISYFYDLDINTTAIGFGNNTILYVLEDPQSLIKDLPLAFVFANRLLFE